MPQGPVLGLLLFLICVNDICKSSDILSYSLPNYLKELKSSNAQHYTHMHNQLIKIILFDTLFNIYSDTIMYATFFQLLTKKQLP